MTLLGILSSSAWTLNLIVMWQISQSSIKNFGGISLKVEVFKIEFSRNYAKLAIKVYVGKSNSTKKLPPLRMELVTSCVLADVLLTELNSSVLSQISDANCKCAL